MEVNFNDGARYELKTYGKRFKTQMKSSGKNEKTAYEGQRSLVGAPKRISLKRKAKKEELDIRGTHKKRKLIGHQDKGSSDKYKSSKAPIYHTQKSHTNKNGTSAKENGAKFQRGAKDKSVKKIKPKHTARKARQVAEAMVSMA